MGQILSYVEVFIGLLSLIPVTYVGLVVTVATISKHAVHR